MMTTGEAVGDISLSLTPHFPPAKIEIISPRKYGIETVMIFHICCICLSGSTTFFHIISQMARFSEKKFYLT
jgi:hypothetical protein